MVETSQPGKIITASVIVIGDEILSGRTKDRNIGYIAEALTAVGIRLMEARVVTDDTDVIVATVNELRGRYSYVFTTGGIGPTHDDITADAIAKAFGVGIEIDQRAVDVMRPRYEEMGLELTPSRLRMARIPFGAELVQNSISRAPGFMLENVIVMAGIPDVMQVMLDDALPRLEKGKPIQSTTIQVDRPESAVADILTEFQSRYPDVPTGSYPFMTKDGYGTQLVLRSIDRARLDQGEAELRAILKENNLI